MKNDWSIDDITRQSLLYDFYGKLLTRRQQEVMELYHDENLSLTEIAEEFGISRQGVHDALRNGQKSLEGYEQKLGLVDRLLTTDRAIERIDAEILTLIGRVRSGICSQEEIIRGLRSVKTIIDQLEE